MSPWQRSAWTGRFPVLPDLELGAFAPVRARRYPKRVFALKGLDILAQGNALGTEEKDEQALKGRDIAKLLMVRPYIPPFQG